MLKCIMLFLLISQPCFSYQTAKNVFFKFDKNYLKGKVLNLNQVPNKDSVFWIKGYIDPTRKKSYNIDLGIKRAINIKKALLNKYGLSKSQVKIVYYGEDLEESILNYQKRRVEIITRKTHKITQFIHEPIKQHEKYAHKNKVQLFSAVEKDHMRSKASSVLETSSPYKDRHYFSLGVYQNILLANDQGTGSEAEWVSKENYNFKTQYQFKYKNFWLGAKASYHAQNYQPELNPIFIWDKEIINLLKLSLVSNYETKKWSLGFDLDFNQMPFIYEQSFNIELKNVLILGTSLQAQYKWFKTQWWSSRVGLNLNYPVLGSSNINSKGDLGYLGFIDLEKGQTFWGYNLNVKLYYGFNNYMNNENHQEEEIAGFLFSLKSLNWL